MKKSLICALALSAASAVQAPAAELPVKAPPPGPVVPSENWRGFYVGVNAGGSWSDQRFGYSLPPFTTPPSIFAVCGTPAGVALPVPTSPNPFGLSNECKDGSSFLGGGQVGYNWQRGPMVFGLEADVQWRKLKDNQFTVFGSNPTAGSPMGAVAADTTYLRSEQGALGTLRGRLGYAPRNWLVYATGGLAIGRVEHSVTEVLSPGTTCTAVSGTTCRNASDSKTKAGWTVGGGAAVAFGRWSLGLEYLYVDLGKTTLTLAPIAGGGFFPTTSTATFHDRSHVARVKLNFQWGAPPVSAKY